MSAVEHFVQLENVTKRFGELTVLKGIDPMLVDVIERLKEELGARETV